MTAHRDRTLVHARARVHTHKRTHTHIHARTHTHTHTHTRTQHMIYHMTDASSVGTIIILSVMSQSDSTTAHRQKTLAIGIGNIVTEHSYSTLMNGNIVIGHTHTVGTPHL